MESILDKIWPHNEPFINKLLVAAIFLFHLLLLAFAFTGWFLISPQNKTLQLIYILSLAGILLFTVCCKYCILLTLRRKCYTAKYSLRQVNAFPTIPKKVLVWIWVVFFVIGVFNYTCPQYSVFSWLSRYFSYQHT